MPPIPAASSALTPTFLARTFGMVATVNAAGSQPSSGSIITSYIWDFGDGRTDAGIATSHTYAVPNRYTIQLTITDSSGLSASTTRYVSPAKTTVDVVVDRVFQADCPYNQYWQLRYRTYGDVLLQDAPPCVNYYPWVLVATSAASQNPSYLATLFHLDARVANHPGYDAWNPVIMPILNAGVGPGPSSYIRFNLSFDYMNQSTVNYWDTTLWNVNPKFTDGTGYLVRGNITMDLQESKRVFGVNGTTPAQAQDWWNANTLPGRPAGTVEQAFGRWLMLQGNGPYDIWNGFTWYYEPDITDLNATVAADGTTTVTVFMDGWGLDVLLARWFYWGAQNYTKAVSAPYWQYPPLGWMPFERCDCENATIQGRIGTSMDLNFSAISEYNFNAIGNHGPDGILGTSDDVAAWAFGAYLEDYVPPAGSGLPGASSFPNSELRWYESNTTLLTTPGGYGYGQPYEYTAVPTRWNMSLGHTLTIAMPTTPVTWYDPVRSTWNTTSRIGNYVTFNTSIGAIEVAPSSGYWLWDNRTNVLSIAATAGFSWANSSLPLGPAPFVEFFPQGAQLKDTTPPTTTASLAGTSGSDGWYVSSVRVTLLAKDTLSGVASTMYSVDSGPWTNYGGPFSVSGDGPHVVVYYSTDVAGNVESNHSATFGIDISPPIASYSVAGVRGSGGWYTSNVTVNLSAADTGSGVANIAYRLDGGTWQAYGMPIHIDDGTHTMDIRATDLAGNVGNLTSAPVDVDTRPPVLAVTSPSGILSTSDVQISWTANDAVSGISGYILSVDGEIAQSGSFSSSAVNETVSLHVSDGTHLVRVRVMDAAGNTAVSEVSFVTDTNVFSPSGPYLGIPTYALVVVAAIALLVLLLRRRRTGKRPPDGNPGSP